MENNSENIQQKKVVFSAIKPTGNPTLGNYLGALKHWGEYQDDCECIYSVADLHAITVSIEPKQLRENTKRMFATLIAVGIDPEKSVLFLQSHVTAHSELAWVLDCFTLFGEARRMTQFKQKSKENPDNINVGLFAYPMLMAADILLYRTDYVPVGHDQLQHVELARNVATRFNNRYSPTFVMPQGITPKAGARIYSLTDPTAKMGKSSADDGGTVYMYDDDKTIAAKFRRAVTDCDTQVKASPDKLGITNLLTIYSAVKGITVQEAEKEFYGVSYGDFKTRVADAVIAELSPVREKYLKLRSDDEKLMEVMHMGANKAAYIARKTLDKVYRKTGFVR